VVVVEICGNTMRRMTSGVILIEDMERGLMSNQKRKRRSNLLDKIKRSYSILSRWKVSL
jgi:hypothetical protein